MGEQVRKGIAALAVLLLASSSMSAQQTTEQADSLVRLMKGKSIELIEIDGKSYRKAIDATFLHNGTYLISDTALWNVEEKMIHAWGHVQVMQDETKLTSEILDYSVEENMARFRGTLVQLENKKKNILRTRYLDYNTKDSIAVFNKGAAMRDEDGQLIESDNGQYDTPTKKFEFWKNVNMFTDSIFVKTVEMYYESDKNLATFPMPIDFWRDGYMLSADTGWYDRGRELFFFTGNVHALSEEQEAWCDSLYYTRGINDVLMLGDVQVKDTTRNVSALADNVHLIDSIKTVILRENAAIALRTEEEDGKVDTLYVGADTLMFRQYRKCDISESEVSQAAERVKDINTDAVTEYRRAAAKAAAEAAEKARNEAKEGLAKVAAPKNDDSAGDDSSGSGDEDASGNGTDDNQGEDSAGQDDVPPPSEDGGGLDAAADSPAAPSDSLRMPVDSLQTPSDSLRAPVDSLQAPSDSLKAPVDSLSAPSDSLSAPLDSLRAAADSLANLPPPDTTKVGFAWGIRNVRIFRKDLQVRCDSMVFSELDSLARFYVNPVVWNDGNRQYSSDSLFVLVKDSRMDRASLMSNAFVITQEDSLCYDQIKGTEILAYFDTTGALRRFDALGGSNAMFYLRENEEFATVNKVESKMLSAVFKDGDIDRVYYFDSPHNDAYPIVQLPETERRMKGFNWMPENRPDGPEAITPLKLKASERSAYRRRPVARFVQADIYFPGYMQGIYREIEVRDSLAKLGPREKDMPDSLSVTEVKDTLNFDRPEQENGEDSGFAVAVPATDVEEGQEPVKNAATHTDTTDSVRQDVTPGGNSEPVSAEPVRQDAAPAVKEGEPAAPPTAEQLRAQKKAQAEEARNQRIAKREARWAELDARDAAKAEAKRQKALEKQRKKTLRAVLAKRRQDAADEAKLQRYIRMYEKRKAREDARKQESESSRERASGTQAGGEVPSPNGAGSKAPGSNALLRDNGSADDNPVLSSGGLPWIEGGTGI